eukprot:g1393.t1
MFRLCILFGLFTIAISMKAMTGFNTFYEAPSSWNGQKIIARVDPKSGEFFRTRFAVPSTSSHIPQKVSQPALIRRDRPCNLNAGGLGRSAFGPPLLTATNEQQRRLSRQVQKISAINEQNNRIARQLAQKRLRTHSNGDDDYGKKEPLFIPHYSSPRAFMYTGNPTKDFDPTMVIHANGNSIESLRNRKRVSSHSVMSKETSNMVNRYWGRQRKYDKKELWS